MQLTTKNVFLIDGIGAMVTALSHGLLLVMLYEYIGMPIDRLYPLAIAAAIFAIYSLTCHFTAKSNWRFLLMVIAISNLVFICITGILLLVHSATLTYIGYAYFIIEIVIVILLSSQEIKLALANREN